MSTVDLERTGLIEMGPVSRGKTRRGFLEKVVKLGAAALPKGDIFERGNPQQEITRQERTPRSVNWDRLYQLVEQVSVLEVNLGNREIIDDIRRNIEDTHLNFGTRMQRIDDLEQAMNADCTPEGRPRLLQLYQTFLGKMRSIKPEEMVPFLNERIYLYQRMVDLEYLLQSIVDSRQEKPTTITGVGEEVLLREKAKKFYGSGYKGKYEFTRDHIAYTSLRVRRETGGDVESRIYGYPQRH